MLIGFGIWSAGALVWRATIVPRLSRGPQANPVTGLMWHAARLYARLMHRARYSGMELVPATNSPGGLIVVSNHTGSADPLLVQAACPFLICWLMARETMFPALDWAWERFRMIPVDRDGADLAPAREAIRIVRGGGVVGIFPEGRIAWPPEEIRPFQNGVGLIIARTKAPVLLVWVSDTPRTTSVIHSLCTPSRARVRFIERLDFSHERDAAAITRQLRERLAAASGWPLNDEPMPKPPRDSAAPAMAEQREAPGPSGP
jgi:1-acyl-sn-glycerol-3-phosphate acyltransferase